MEFTLESIYDQIGRYNATVIIAIKPETEEYAIYGSELIGTFLYSNKERAKMTELTRELNDNSKTHGKIRFKSNNEDKLTSEQIIKLRRFGISTTSIANLFYVNPPEYKDAFVEEGIKEIPYEISIPTQIQAPNHLIRLVLGLYGKKKREGWKFIDEEVAEYLGLKLLKKDNCVQELLEEYQVDDNPNMKDRIDYYNLRARYWLKNGDLPKEDKKRLDTINSNYVREVFSQFRKEFRVVMKNDVTFIKKYPEIAAKAYYESLKFKSERLVERDPAIWWDPSGFAHIMFRHALEFENDQDNRDKTRFQYKIPEVIRVIKTVCEIVYDEYVANGCKDFFREGIRAVEFNGNHYCLRIDSNGLLTQFFPYKKEIRM